MTWLVLVLSFGFAPGRLSEPLLANAEGLGAGEGAPPCGDVNSDATTDISDPVYLLSWLFLGGPQPLCPDPDCARASPLPATGQTLCYDEGGDEIPCDSATCPAQDGFYRVGCSLEGRFIDNQDGTVTDTCTGLMWQQEIADVNGDGVFSEELNGGDRAPWCEALAYCEGLTFAGHDDWRLPNVRELESLVDYSRSEPTIDPVFPSAMTVVTSIFWSSSSFEIEARAWSVSFFSGTTGSVDKRTPLSVRAVRGGR